MHIHAKNMNNNVCMLNLTKVQKPILTKTWYHDITIKTWYHHFQELSSEWLMMRHLFMHALLYITSGCNVLLLMMKWWKKSTSQGLKLKNTVGGWLFYIKILHKDWNQAAEYRVSFITSIFGICGIQSQFVIHNNCGIFKWLFKHVYT